MKIITFLFGLALVIAIIIPTKGGPVAVATPTAGATAEATPRASAEAAAEAIAKAGPFLPGLPGISDLINLFSPKVIYKRISSS